MWEGAEARGEGETSDGAVGRSPCRFRGVSEEHDGGGDGTDLEVPDTELLRSLPRVSTSRRSEYHVRVHKSEERT
jgi:hypothetical protein